MHAAQRSQRRANDLRGAWRATMKASAAASKIRKNGEWKRPRCERRLEERIPKSRLPARSKSGTTARSPALIGMAHRGKIAYQSPGMERGQCQSGANDEMSGRGGHLGLDPIGHCRGQIEWDLDNNLNIHGNSIARRGLELPGLKVLNHPLLRHRGGSGKDGEFLEPAVPV